MSDRHVLLVEDNETLAESVSMLLVEEGFEVDVIHRGRQVIGMIACEHPDAVVLDVTLPDIDGVTVAMEIRRSWPELPIIFATGHDDVERPKMGQPLRTAVLHKPFEISVLVKMIEEVTHAAVETATDR